MSLASQEVPKSNASETLKMPENVHTVQSIMNEGLVVIENGTKEEAQDALTTIEAFSAKLKKGPKTEVSQDARMINKEEIRQAQEAFKQMQEIFARKKVFGPNYLAEVAGRLEKATDEEKASAKEGALNLYKQFAVASPEDYKKVLTETLNIVIPESVSNEDVADYFDKAMANAKGVVELVYGLNQKVEVENSEPSKEFQAAKNTYYDLIDKREEARLELMSKFNYDEIENILKKLAEKNPAFEQAMRNNADDDVKRLQFILYEVSGIAGYVGDKAKIKAALQSEPARRMMELDKQIAKQQKVLDSLAS